MSNVDQAVYYCFVPNITQFEHVIGLALVGALHDTSNDNGTVEPQCAFPQASQHSCYLRRQHAASSTTDARFFHNMVIQMKRQATLKGDTIVVETTTTESGCDGQRVVLGNKTNNPAHGCFGFVLF